MIENILNPNSDVYILMKSYDNQNLFEGVYFALSLNFMFGFGFLFFPLRKNYEDLINSKIFLILSTENWAGYIPITHYPGKIVFLMIAVLPVSSDSEDYYAILHLLEWGRI